MFQTAIEVTALDGAAPVFLPVDDPLDEPGAVDDPEEAHLRLLYRNERRCTSGPNVAVHAQITGDDRAAGRLTTRWLPTFDVPATVAPALDGVELWLWTRSRPPTRRRWSAGSGRSWTATAHGSASGPKSATASRRRSVRRPAMPYTPQGWRRPGLPPASTC